MHKVLLHLIYFYDELWIPWKEKKESASVEFLTEAKCRAAALSAVTTNYSIGNSQALVCWLPFLHQKKENALLVFATDMQFFDFQMIGACSVNKSATYLLGCICKVQRTPMMEERPGMIVYAGPIFCYWKRWSKMRPHQTCWKCPIGQVRVLKFHFWGRLFLMGIGLMWSIFIKLICPLQSEYWDTMLQFHSCSGPLTLA